MQRIFNNPTLLSAIQSKRLTRAQHKVFSVGSIVTEVVLNIDTLTLTILAQILIGTVRIYNFKTKILLNEVIEMCGALTKPKEKIRRILQLSRNPFTLDVSNYSFQNEIREAQESSAVEFLDQEMMFSEVEMQRADGSLLVESVHDMIEAREPRRKRRIFDRNVSYENDEFKMKKVIYQQIIPGSNTQTLNMPDEIVDFLKNIRRPEVARDEIDVDFFEPHYSNLASYNENSAEEMISEDVIVHDEELPEMFIFQEHVAGKNKNDQAHIFLRILNMCSEGRMICEQARPFGNICCNVIA